MKILHITLAACLLSTMLMAGCRNRANDTTVPSTTRPSTAATTGPRPTTPATVPTTMPSVTMPSTIPSDGVVILSNPDTVPSNTGFRLGREISLHHNDKTLVAGDVVDIEAFLYYYADAINPHITAIAKVA